MTIPVHVDNATNWLEYLVAFGTLGAAVFAGAAAGAAWRSARATERSAAIARTSADAAGKSATAAEGLVGLEHDREDRAAEERRWRHARRVVLALQLEPVATPRGPGFDVQALVHNTGDDPIRHCRLRIEAEGTVWGPQYLGHLGRNEEGGILVRLFSDGDIASVKGYIAFVDVNLAKWVVDGFGDLLVDEKSPEEWTAEARRFVAEYISRASVLERGTTIGAFQARRPDFNLWRRQEIENP